MADRVKLLIQRRTSLKSQITSLTNVVAKGRYDKIAVKLRMARITELYHAYEEFNDELVLLDPNNGNDEEFTNVQERFYSIASKEEEIVNPIVSGASNNVIINESQPSTSGATATVKRRVKLPEASLPHFDGQYENWLSFKNTFIAMIDSQSDLTDVEKLQYLKSALTGEAANKIKILSIEGANYSKAWELLRRSYEVKRILISRHLSLLLNMPALAKESTDGLIKLADDAQQHVASLSALGVNVESEILVNLLESKLPKNVAEKWEEILDRDDFPKIDDLYEFLYRTAVRVSKRLSAVTTKLGEDKIHSSPKKRRIGNKAYVANVTNNCVACKDKQHPLFKCNTFKQLTIPKRIELVKDAMLCYNCLRSHRDIEKMYRQIESASPFLAIKTVQKLADDERDVYPAAARVLKEHLYVDNLLSGASTVNEARKLRDDVITVTSQGGFNMREWASNDKRVLADLNSDAINPNLIFDKDNPLNTLGMMWRTHHDMDRARRDEGGVEEDQNLLMEKETENLPVEEESQDALVDYDSDSSVVTVVERETRVCSAGKDRSLKTIKSTIEAELNNQRLHIRREYKLTQKSNFDLWMDYLKSELINNDLLDVIDSNIESPENLSELKVAKRKSLVRDIIINHLDENYHKRILHEKDPTEILKKLRGYKKSEINVTHASVRSRLYQIKMRKDEKVSDFCERFDSIIREYESCEDAVPLTEQEIRSAFYQAVSINVPELRNVDLIRRQTNLKEMNIDEIKSFMMQLEAEMKSESREKLEKPEIRVQRAAVEEVKCYRCNRMGHMAKDCPLVETGSWFCYYCQEVRGHKGDNCPSAKAQASRARGKRYLNKTVNKNIKNKGRFVQKGTKRVDNQGKITKIQPAKKPTPTKTAKEGKSEEGKLRMDKLIEDRESPKELVNFIVDSGATDHIVNKNIILSNFEKCNNRVIKCANKNKLADISIDGKGDLLLLTNEKEKKVIKLTNVIATKEVSENLLSLRKLADAGFSIYLDDKLFKVYNKLTNKIVFEGIYEKPNWIIQFEVKNNNLEDNDNVECAVYRCRAEIVPHSELPEQSQANIQTNELSISEGELDERDNVGSAIGKENEGELTNVNENIEHNNAELEQVIKLEDIQTIENIEEMCESSVIEKVKKLEKINEAMLWHVRLGHASLNYLRQLQKVEKRLETVKFNNSILECEVCIMVKMAKLPFKENRNRAQRPLQVIHTDIMGPIKPTSYPGQKRFIITFIDDYSRLAKAYSLKTKDESGEALKKYLISARNLLGKEEKLCYVKSDRQGIHGRYI
ncbi:LOW QUALITY PROTEIN: uncharacterized protein [Temnothorax nylanderi]|uniref:LOW QUALITY PROTEIN: uncharacterized protein n=1 Tax=Temnothorax nylanderi TaxID=102681 RepID=UPI003A84EAFC